jgi:hypothetical protein
MKEDRYDRQRRLSGVGEAGQLAIQAWNARVPAGPGEEVALAYLVRAGVGSATVSGAGTSVFPHGDHFSFDGPRAVASGAHRALVELKQALASIGEGAP